MSAKFVIALIAIACIVVSEATVAILTYVDSACTTPMGYYGGTAQCQVAAKRMVEGGTPTCEPFTVEGPFFRVYECNTDTTAPNTAIPDAFQSMKTAFNTECDYSNGFDIVAVAFSSAIPLVIYVPMIGYIPTNTTIVCNNGEMSYTTCVDQMGCTIFNPVLNNVCAVANATIDGSPVPSGIQTTCIPPPQAPMAPMAAPMTATPVAPIAAPVAAPKAATPVKKSSDAVSLAVGSALVFATTAALL